MKPDYKKIQYFLKVAETLNFSKAAEQLYISTQALNKHILNLEDELNMQLFECTTRNVKLTELGEEFRKSFLPVQVEYQRACDKIDKFILKKEKTLRVGFFQAISKKEIINPLIQILRAADGELRVEAIAGELDEVNQWLQTGEIDLCITNIHQFESWDEVETIPFVEIPAQIVVSLYHPWVVKNEITKEDLGESTFLAIKRKKNIEEDGYYRYIKGRECHFVSNFNSLLANLETENHFAVMPRLFESMNWSSLRYFDLPEEYRFNFRMVAMYYPNNKFKTIIDGLQTVAEENILKLSNV